MLYFEKIINLIVTRSNSPVFNKALLSLATDAGLHPLVPYFIYFVVEEVIRNLTNFHLLFALMRLVWSLLQNPFLHIEPYADGSGSVFFLDSPVHRYLRSPSSSETIAIGSRFADMTSIKLSCPTKYTSFKTLFCPRERGGRVFNSPDFNQPMQQQREMSMKRIDYLRKLGVFNGWLTRKGAGAELSGFTRTNSCGVFDHSLGINLGVHFFLWGGAIKFMGAKRHHNKWLKPSESYEVKGCFAMTELGHGSNVWGIETVTRYDAATQEFIISTPCESAQKYWIGGAANDATHTVVFSQLEINGVSQGVHAFIAQLRDVKGNICPNVCIADCGHKLGLNGVDDGRIWYRILICRK